MSYLLALPSPACGGLYCVLFAAGGTGSFAVQSTLLAVAFILIMAGTYYLSRRMTGTRTRSHGGGNMQIAEVLGVGINSTVQLIRVGERYYLIGVTKERIVYLTEVPKADIEVEQVAAGSVKGGFEKYLQKFLTKDAGNKEDEASGIDEKDNDTKS